VTDRHAARCVALLGHGPGPIVVVAPGAPALGEALGARFPLATDGAPGTAAVVCFAGTPADPSARQTTLRALDQRLPSGAPVVVVDHNQPRQPWRRILGALRLVAAGLTPARARYPTARELHALGFRIERLELSSGERFQFILARRR
jgi:hypothetical protein